MKVLIIEDENLVAKSLQRLLKQTDPSIEVVAILDSVLSSVQWLKENPHPDLLFMDIQLSDGVSFEIFKKVEVNKPIIFTTAYDEYAIRAFKVNSVDYLLKPVDATYLRQALDKFYKYHSADQAVEFNEQILGLMESIRRPDVRRYKERFLVHYKSGMVPIVENRVAYFVKDTLIYLVTTENEKLVTDYNTLEEIEEVMNPALFFRANRQIILHINQISNYKKHDTGKTEVSLKCDKSMHVDVSREKSNEFKNWLDQ